MADTKTAKLERLAQGSIFIYGGIRWIILEPKAHAATVLAVDLLPDTMPFDKEDKNNFATSSLRAFLNGEFLESLVAAGADAEAFLDTEFDLTSDDGLTEYGKDRCKIGLISCEQYRRFRNLIPDVDNAWWTITPYSTAKNGYSRYARNVNSGGTLSYGSAYYGDYAARPLCNLSSSIFVSFDPSEVQVDWNERHAEEAKAEQRANAIDMMRHIAAAWNISPEEFAEIIGNNAKTEDAPTLPAPVKHFLREVVGVPEAALEAALVERVPGGFSVTIGAGKEDAAQAEDAPQDTPAAPEKPENPFAAFGNALRNLFETTTEDAEDQPGEDTPKPKDAAALRVEMQDLITYTRERFEKCGGGGFNPECFSTLMMAYRSAIEMGSWGDED